MTKCEFVPLGSIRHNESIFPALCNKQLIYFRYYSIVLSLDTVEILPTEDFQITKPSLTEINRNLSIPVGFS